MTQTTNPPSPLFFYCVLITLFLATFYNTITNIAGIYIAYDLGGNQTVSLYPTVFFGLGNALSIPLTTALANRFGTIKLFVYGLLAYLIFSTLCGTASLFFLFNVYRVGLGCASGLFYVLCRNLILKRAPEERRESYMYIMTLMYSLVPVLGVCFGGWLAYESYWRWIFHLNGFVALLIAAYFWFYFRQLDVSEEQKGNDSTTSFDKIGYIFFALSSSCLVTAATLSQQLDWFRSTTFLLLITIGIPCLIFFILWELNHPKPLLELQLFRSPLLSFALINLAVLFSAYFGMVILVTLWLNLYVSYTPLWVSLILGVMILSGIFVHLLCKYVLSLFDPRWTLAFAIFCFALSCYYSTYFNVNVDFFHLAVARFISGSGLVLFAVPLMKMALDSHGPEKSLPVFTLFQVVRAISSSLGVGLYVILWQRRQVFFYERLGENITPEAPLTADFFQRAVKQFHLTKAQATEQLHIYINQHATSLALNDAFACMGYICLGLFVLLIFSFVRKWA